MIWEKSPKIPISLCNNSAVCEYEDNALAWRARKVKKIFLRYLLDDWKTEFFGGKLKVIVEVCPARNFSKLFYRLSLLLLLAPRSPTPIVKKNVKKLLHLEEERPKRRKSLHTQFSGASIR